MGEFSHTPNQLVVLFPTNLSKEPPIRPLNSCNYPRSTENNALITSASGPNSVIKSSISEVWTIAAVDCLTENCRSLNFRNVNLNWFVVSLTWRWHKGHLQWPLVSVGNLGMPLGVWGHFGDFSKDINSGAVGQCFSQPGETQLIARKWKFWNWIEKLLDWLAFCRDDRFCSAFGWSAFIKRFWLLSLFWSKIFTIWKCSAERFIW